MNKWLERKKQDMQVRLDVPGEVQAQLAMIQLTLEDLKTVKAIQPLVEEHIGDVVDAFYNSILQVGKLQAIIDSHSTVERLRMTLRRHLTELFSGEIDSEFVAKRIRIAQVHQKIGLEPKWYIGAFQNLQNALLAAMQERPELAGSRIEVDRVIAKLLNFEQQLVLEAYEKENLRERESQYERAKTELKDKFLHVSQELAALTEETSASIQELVASSDEVNRAFADSVDLSKATRQLADQGQIQIGTLEQSIGSINDSTAQMEGAVRRLNESSGQIGEIVKIVREIADQTKLLSLNASIEAAHAGEHGRGFAVVAGEVQKLSESTKQTVEQISRLIAESGAITAEVVGFIRQVRELANSGRAETVKTREIFDSILTSMLGSLESAERVENDLVSLVQGMEEIGRASELVAQSAETINHTTLNL